MKKVKWGILGAGNIARKFAQGLKGVENAVLYCVSSRNLEKADRFAKEFNIPKAFGSYEEMLDDEGLDVVYIATPHTFHMEHSIMSMDKGKSVLCEKPFAINQREVRQMIDGALKNDVFLMEAMWTRFLPVIKKVKEWVDQNLIGDIRIITADFGFRSSISEEGRLFNRQLGGGSLMDVGIYPISFASMFFGTQPEEITCAAHMGETGVDEQIGIVLKYGKGQIALLHSAIRTNTAHIARITGTEGEIVIPDFWKASEAVLKTSTGRREEISIPFKENGYCYEAEEVTRCILEGKKYSELMSPEESFEIVGILDEIRRKAGLVYPAD